MLPPDLRTAEAELFEALQSALAADCRGRWTVELRFEGLRLLAPVLRLATALERGGTSLQLLFADAGAAALARRDGADLASRIASFGDALRRQGDGAGSAEAGGGDSLDPQGSASEQAAPPLLILVAPSQADYGLVEPLCQNHQGGVVLVNPSLEDAAIGIGSVARQRRRGFLAGWTAAYALIPRGNSALRRCHPGDWELCRLDADGYRAVASFPQRPDSEQQEAALGGGEAAGLAATLRSVDRLLEGLQN